MPWLSTGPIEVDDKPSSILTIANECTIVLTVANDATPCNLAILTKYIYSSTVAREALVENRVALLFQFHVIK
jgi:hypothetical protein